MKNLFLILIVLPSILFAQIRTDKLGAKVADRVNKICPYDRLSIPNPDDKSTWTIVLTRDATPEQRAAVDRLIQNWTDKDWEGSPEERHEKTFQKLLSCCSKLCSIERLLELHPNDPFLESQLQKVLEEESFIWAEMQKDP